MSSVRSSWRDLVIAILPALLATNLLASPVRAEGAGEAMLNIRSSESRITYHIVHKLHRVDGTSRKVAGKVRILPSGQAQVMIRVPVESFDSANANRDSHVKETLEAARFPTVDLKASCEGIQVPASLPGRVEKACKAQISFHGVQKALDVSVQIEYQAADRIRVTSALTLSLEEFKVERPSLMFVKVDDALNVDVDLLFDK